MYKGFNDLLKIEILLSNIFKKKQYIHLAVFKERLSDLIYKSLKKSKRVECLFYLNIETIINYFIEKKSIDIDGNFKVRLYNIDKYLIEIEHKEVFSILRSKDKTIFMNRSVISGEINTTNKFAIKKIIENESND